MMQKQNTFVIAIGRQFGCGGREIGKAVAQLLNIAYYDKELLSEASKSSGVNQDFFEAADERSPNFFATMFPFHLGYSAGAYLMPDTPLSDDSMYCAQSRVIAQLAKRESCVIVGRTADYILHNQCRVLSVFLHASLGDRVTRIIARGDASTPKEAQEMAEKYNKLRAEYYNFYTDKKWGNAESYDLTINTSTLGIDATAQLIAHYAQQILKQER